MDRLARRQSRPGRILVVDDDPATVDMIRAWFRGKPYEFLEAPNGVRGLALATEQNPDLVLLDLTMPGIDGITVAARLRTDARTRTIPVILLTACRDTNAKVKALNSGADDYVTKPFEFEELQARIDAMLRRRRQLLRLEGEVQGLSEDKQQLEQLLVVDEKTGLFNFREFQRRLREEWQRAARYGVPLSLVFMDLDHFKQINDTMGHPKGDRVLQEFAALVAGGARVTDVAARYGGEEFAVILPHTDRPMARRVAERIRRAVQEFVFLQRETPVRVTVSAGVATRESTGGFATVEELISAADTALYAAKDRGRNRVVEAHEAESVSSRRGTRSPDVP